MVIGGGLLGCATAYYLARDGMDVLLLERRELNREASGTNAGSLHFQILRQDDYSAARFAQLRPTVELHECASALWKGLEEDLQADLGIRRLGGLLVAENREQLDTLRRKVELENSMGVKTELVGPADIREICPGLSEHLAGADYHSEEGFANPLVTVPAFARAALKSGARIRLHCPVNAIDPRPGGRFRLHTGTGTVDAGRVVDAAGAWSGEVAEMVGLRLPLTARVLHVNVTEPRPPLLRLLIQHAGRRLTLKQKEQGNFLIGGGWPGRADPETEEKTTTHGSLAGNTWVAAATFPPLRNVRVIRTWAGQTASSPDLMPTLGESRTVRGFFAMQGGAGFTLGPVYGRLMAELVRTGRTSIPIAPYDPERFMATAV